MKKKLKIVGSISVIVILALLCSCDAQEVSKENLKSIETISTTIEEQSNLENSEHIEEIEDAEESTSLVQDEETYQSIDKPIIKILISMIDELNTTKELEWFYNEVEKAELTAEDEVKLAKLDEGVLHNALLLRSNLTAEGLIATCEAEFKGSYGYTSMQVEMLNNAVERVQLTAEDEVKLAKLDESILHNALLLRSNLTAEGLIATCEAEFEGSYGYGSKQMEMLNNAVERVELTAEDEVKLAKLDESILHNALLLRSNLTAEGLIATCEAEFKGSYGYGSKQMEMLNNAVKRVELTDDQLLRLKAINASVLNKALMLKFGFE